MKRNRFLPAGILFLTLCACKQKKQEDKSESFFPVLSFLKSQVAHVDTSFYTIKKINYIDSAHTDTVYVKREEFRGLAKDFLDLPDLSDKKFKKIYTEEKLYDASLNRVILTYKPLDPDKQEIQKQEVLITPDEAAGDQVRSFIIDRIMVSKDSSVQKRMLWQADQSFQVTTISQKPGQPERIYTLKVTWE
jgi:hypothetical protein